MEKLKTNTWKIMLKIKNNLKTLRCKKVFKLKNNAFFGRSIENRKRYEASNNWKKKELFSLRIKLSRNNFFLRIYYQ